MSTDDVAVSFPALGTSAVLLTTDPDDIPTARTIFETEIDAIDRTCSRFRDDSELQRLNRSPGGAVAGSDLLLEAISVALRAARITGGLVSPTVARAMRILGYDGTFAEVERDGAPVRARVGPVPGWEVIAVDRCRREVRRPSGIELDLGATAKALCADRSANAIWRSIGCGVLVSLGGDVATAGPAPAGGWSILVTDDHAAPLDAVGDTIAIRSGGLATSGTAVRHWIRGGRPLHHLIDPATGWPAGSEWRTASVAAASCVDANIASTAAMILGAGAPQWLTRHQLPARLVRTDGTIEVLGGWPAPIEVLG